MLPITNVRYVSYVAPYSLANIKSAHSSDPGELLFLVFMFVFPDAVASGPRYRTSIWRKGFQIYDGVRTTVTTTGFGIGAPSWGGLAIFAGVPPPLPPFPVGNLPRCEPCFKMSYS